MGKRERRGTVKRTRRPTRARRPQAPPQTPQTPPKAPPQPSSERRGEPKRIFRGFSYRRAPEMKRRTNFVTRPLIALTRLVLYLILIPVMICGGVVGASLELGATWSESVNNVIVVRDATIETYETYWDLAKLSAQILLELDDGLRMSELELMKYVAEVKSRTSALSAKVDRTLADYLNRQVEQRKRRDEQRARSRGEEVNEPVTIYEVMKSASIGAAIPLLIYWFFGYLLTRVWLAKRARETLELHQERVERLQRKRKA